MRLWALVAASCLLVSCARRETPVQRGNRDQVLERGSHADVSDLDPQLATSITELDITSALFEGLMAEDPVDLHPVPGVASRYVPSPDRLTYTFYLRPDARWSDGSAVTADDFVRSWQRMLTPSLAAQNADLLYVIQGAEAYNRGVTKDFSHVGVRAIDPHTLRVTLEHPTPYFLSLLAQPAFYPVRLATIAKYGSTTQRGNPWTRPGHLVGNGPFVLKTWIPNEAILVTKSPTYWDAAHVRLHAIRFHAIDSVDAEEDAFRAGQLHLTYVLPFGRAAVYRRKDPKVLRSDPYLNTYFLRLNTTRAPFDDPRFRRALSLAIDRDALANKVLQDGQKPAVSFTPPGLPGYTPPDVVKSDPAEARRLLAETTFGKLAKAPTIELLFNSSENMRLIAEALQGMWQRNLGLNVQLVNEEFKVVLSDRRAGHYQMVLSDWVADYLDPLTFLDPWRSDSANNQTGWSSVDYDALLFAAAQNPDPQARAAQLQKAETLLLDAAPIIPLYYNPHTFLIQPSVKGWYPTLLDHHPYKAVWLEPASQAGKRQ